MSDFREIPGLPGYFINALGKVKSRNRELVQDAHDRYTLYTNYPDKSSRKKFKVEKLLIMAGFEYEGQETQPADLIKAQQKISELKLELTRANKSVTYLRRLNAVFWSRLRSLGRDLASLDRAGQRERLAEEKQEWDRIAHDLEEYGIDFCEASDE